MQIIAERLLKNAKFILLSMSVFFCLLEKGYATKLYQYVAPLEAQLLFNNQLYFKSDNGYTMFYVGETFITHDAIVITDADITVKKIVKRLLRTSIFLLIKGNVLALKY